MHEARLGLDEADFAGRGGDAGEVVRVDVDGAVRMEEGLGTNVE